MAVPSSSNQKSEITNLKYLTEETPGIGGVLKQRPEDFLVDEQPLYEPSGAGEHLYVFIEKRELTTSDAVRHLARIFRVGRGDVGYAGLKDKHAITRQHLSVHLPGGVNDQELLKNVDTPRVKLLWAQRHGNKLRRGHHAGNRFAIRVRGVEPTSVVHAKRVLDRLVAQGAPNYVGEQRFGYRGTNGELGRLLLLGRFQEMLDLMLGTPRETDYEQTRAAREAYERRDYAAALELWPRHLKPDRQALDALRGGRPAEAAVRAIELPQREFLISAFQSAVFNRVLHERIERGLFSTLVEGDLTWKHDSRAVFAVDQATAESENAPAGRVATLAVSPSGPMWGVGMTKPAGQVLAWEEEALRGFDLQESDLAGGPQGNAHGSRRPMRATLRDADVSGGVDEHGAYVRVAFELPRGSFATSILREIMKSGGHDAAEETGEEG